MIFDANFAFCQQIQPKTNTVKAFAKSYFSRSEAFYPQLVVKEVISPNFYARNLTFFCRQELKWERVSGIPLKFRLGSVSVCDWQEGKNSARLGQVR
jgi:hypothetical protein